ncbi:MAG: hypothetical protein JKY42_12150 [Flavobacteriales bacterium]|nr:hypothetical protein [Flavobacteriales bacterium]
MKPKILFKETVNNVVKQKVNDLFPVKHFSFGEIVYGGKIVVSIVEFEELKDLVENWQAFNSHISTEILSNIQNEFSRWNFYIFYISKEKIGIDLKYEIENNKFGSRKTLIDLFDDEININSITEIIKEHITNENIIEVKDLGKKSILKKDAIISMALNEIEISTGKNAYNEYLDNVLSKIEKELTDEV